MRQLCRETRQATSASSGGSFVDEMMTFTACGTPDDVRAYLEEFQRFTGADEFMTVHQAAWWTTASSA